MKAEEVKKQVMSHYSDLKNDTSLECKYPELDKGDGKKHVLFVQCLLERIGFYRTYLPYLMLNDSDTHSAIITSIQKRDFNKSFADYEVFLSMELIDWADYIVFPALLFDCKKIFSSILEINPNIKFVIDIDATNYGVKNNEDSTRQIEDQLLDNIKITNTVTFSSSQLREKIQGQFESKYGCQNKHFTCLPTFLVSSYLKRRPDDILESSSSIKVGLKEGNFYQETIDAIAKVAKQEEKEVKVFVYGQNKDELKFPESIEVEFIKPVKFLDYFITIEKLNLDFMVLLGFNSKSEQAEAIFQYGELALLSIPILCNSTNQARRFIKPNINGFVITKLETLEYHLQVLLKSRNLAKKAGKAAQGMALKHLSWNPERASQLINIYK